MLPAMISREEITRLSAVERLALIGALWDSIEDEAGATATTPQCEELLRRLDSFESDKANALAWSDLKAELANRKA